jgi:hypothetical protein
MRKGTCPPAKSRAGMDGESDLRKFGRQRILLERRMIRKIITAVLFAALLGTLAIADRSQDRDDKHDNGKHKGQDDDHHPGWYLLFNARL